MIRTRHAKTMLAVLTAVVVPAWGSMAWAQLWLEPRCTRLPFDKIMPVLALSDGRLLKVEGTVFRTSSDDGKTWSPARKIYDGPKPGIPSSDEASSQLLRTRSGALVLVYMDMSTEKWKWDGAKNEAAPDSRLDVWAIRSLDEGNTWIDRQKILDGYCGALIGTIQTTSGQLVTPMQTMLDGRRHVTVTRVSADDGKTWQGGNIIDLGGRGDHDGAIEATVTQLATGRLLMLIRTNLDRFWEAYSDDEGRCWRELRPSQLDASSSPGHLIRLASGRLALAWNRLCAEGKPIVRRAAAGLAETAASWQREELSLAFSTDDAKSWSKPVVIARRRGEAWPIRISSSGGPANCGSPRIRRRFVYG